MSALSAIGNTSIVEFQSYNGCPRGRILARYETTGPEMMAHTRGRIVLKYIRVRTSRIDPKILCLRRSQ